MTPSQDAHAVVPVDTTSSAAVKERRVGQVTREEILSLLTDEETARVANAEGETRLPEGEEYLDLEHLDMGVRRRLLETVAMGGVLPRRAVQEETWSRILKRLEA